MRENIIIAYTKLKDIIAKIPAYQRQVKIINGTGGKVSISDIIAYQIGWGKLLISWYQAGLNNENFSMPGEGFAKWDYVGLAKHFYQKYHYDGNKYQDKEFYCVVEQILLIIEKENITGNLDKLNIWPWCTLTSGKHWPLSKWITINTIAPYKRATNLIKKVFISK